MRSSIGDTKILAFCFILVYLFLKVKMCVGTVGAAAAAAGSTSASGDSDINYYEGGDESFQPAVPPYKPSGPANGQHHVRHHHDRHRHNVQAAEQQAALRAHHRSSVVKPAAWATADSGHRRWPHQRRHASRVAAHQTHVDLASRRTFGFAGSPSSSSSGDGLRTRDSRSGLSNNILPKPSYSDMRRLPSSTSSHINNNKHKSSSGHKKPSHVQHSKQYFEELLNSFKANSPYYKKDSSQLTKSMDTTRVNCNDKKCKNDPVKSEENEDEDYYEYEEEEEDDDDEDDDEEDSAEEGDYEYDDTETQGDAGYSTTASPALNEIDVTNDDYPQQHHKPSRGSQKSDNSLFENTQDVARDKNTPPSHPNRADTAPESKITQKEAEAKQYTLATSHVHKVRKEGNCSTPKPKIVLASTDPTKQYTPHCTILHRCGDDVGCCPSTQTCAASKNATVELYFFVRGVGSRPSIERLSFVNHTECACISRHELPRNRKVLPPTVATAAAPTAPPPPPICTCPAFFQRVIDNDNHCFCDCSSSDAQCDQFKRGLEHFSMENRRCINNGRCEVPVCEHGHYNKAKGKCPTERDRLSITFKG